MQDRIVEHPNRYRMISVGDGLVDLIPAPGQVVQEGTPLSKATLLSDTTADAIGAKSSPAEWIERNLPASFDAEITVTFESRYGTSETSERVTFTRGNDGYSGSLLKSLNIKSNYEQSYLQEFFLAGVPAEVFNRTETLKSECPVSGYERSDWTKSSAGRFDCANHPPLNTVVDSMTFTLTVEVPNNPTVNDALRTLDSKFAGRAQLAAGSYVGTGTYGENAPCSLTFGFVPDILFVSGLWLASDSTGYETRILIPSGVSDFSPGGLQAPEVTVSFAGQTVKWYAESMHSNTHPSDYGAQQANKKGETYHWLAIGHQEGTL